MTICSVIVTASLQGMSECTTEDKIQVSSQQSAKRLLLIRFRCYTRVRLGVRQAMDQKIHSGTMKNLRELFNLPDSQLKK